MPWLSPRWWCRVTRSHSDIGPSDHGKRAHTKPVTTFSTPSGTPSHGKGEMDFPWVYAATPVSTSFHADLEDVQATRQHRAASCPGESLRREENWVSRR